MFLKHFKCAGTLIVSFILSAAIPAVAQDLQNEVIKHNNDGVKLLNEFKFDDALQEFDKALRLDADYRIASDNIVVAKKQLSIFKAAKECEKTGKYKEAAGLYSKLMENDDNPNGYRAKILHMRGLAKQEAGDLRGARADFKQEQIDLLAQKRWDKDRSIWEREHPNGE